MKVTCTWADGTVNAVETFQVDDLAAEDAGWGGPEGFRSEPDDTAADGVRQVPTNADGTDYTARQMLRFLRASAKAALARTGDPRAATFDTDCLEVMPGDDADPTPPAQPGG